MKRSDLINLLMNKHKYLTSKEVESLIDIVFSEMSVSLINGGRVELRGFGSFSTRHRDARIARNPRTGDKVEVSSKKMPYFRAGKNLAKLLNK